jgi:hypothetical protein
MNILFPEDFGIFKQRFNIRIFDDLKLILSFAIYYGLLIGGICLVCIGGYEDKECSIFLSVCFIISFFSLLIIDLSFNISIFCLGIFMFFFVSAPFLIISKCIIISSFSNKYKGFGVALSLLLENISKLVSPIFFEFLNSSFGNSFLPLIIHLIIYSIIFCLYSSFYRYRNIKNENVKEIKNDKEKELEDIEKL